MKKKLPQTVVALGLVSFFTDLSSEMIYPLLPLFLASLGAGSIAIGIIEGIAESTAAFLKLYAGVLTDRWGKRKPFVLFGYGIAGFAKPLIGLATSWLPVLSLRFVDRVGKGFRSSPRDALITDVVSEDMRGRAFGFHRAMDHAGSVAGPLIAAALVFLGFSMPQIFYVSAIPSLIVLILIIFFVRETKNIQQAVAKKRSRWSDLPKDYRKFLLVLGLFTLGNASDMFLLFALSKIGGLEIHQVLILWAIHSAVKMVAAHYAGGWTDRKGSFSPIFTGWLAHVLVYFIFAFSPPAEIMMAVFILYGLSNGLSEPAEKTLTAQLAPAGKKGTAFGYYHLIIGLTALPGSLLFGILWETVSPSSAFIFDASLAAIALLLFTRRRVG